MLNLLGSSFLDRRRSTCVAVLAILLAVGPVSAQSNGVAQDALPEWRVAVVVGVDDYADKSGFEPLRFPARDAQSMYDLLGRLGFLVNKITGAEADREAILRAIDETRKWTVSDNTVFLFYFSGHGFAEDGVNYLAPSGAKARDLASTGIALPELRAALRKTGVDHPVVILDTCRHQPDFPERTCVEEQAGSDLFLSTRNLGYESSELKHGIFTHFLLKGLKGEAEDEYGFIRLSELVRYTSKRVRSWSGQRQDPYSARNEADDVVLARITPELQLEIDQHIRLAAGNQNQLVETVAKLMDLGEWDDEKFQEMCMDSGSDASHFNICREGIWAWAKSSSRLWADPRAAGKERIELEDLNIFYNLSGKRAVLERKVILALLSTWCRGYRSTPRVSESDAGLISCMDRLPTLATLGIIKTAASLSHIEVVEENYDGCNSSTPDCS